ncbi:9226_t:CDS:2 [Funneliformis mosseae]|uniref:9226_t:CDS:1 n=1 Tax=Funneliformis mosseae TaxID=27381 RepID=A0A9N9C870_FUNMO|nr:9226_t:CDS:2 [Funneliformis mosseae]
MDENVNRNTIRKHKSRENETPGDHEARLAKQHERYHQKKATETTEQRDARWAKTAAAKAAARPSHKTTTAAAGLHETAAGSSHKTTAAAGSYENAAERSLAEST